MAKLTGAAIMARALKDQGVDSLVSGEFPSLFNALYYVADQHL